MTDKQLLYAQQLIESDEQHRYNAYTKFIEDTCRERERMGRDEIDQFQTEP